MQRFSREGLRLSSYCDDLYFGRVRADNAQGCAFRSSHLHRACASTHHDRPRAATIGSAVPRPFPGAPVASAPVQPGAPDACAIRRPDVRDGATGPLHPRPRLTCATADLLHRISSPAGSTAGPSPQFAMGFRGVPYRLGGADPAGFDCSGLVQYVFAQYGVAVPRVVEQQWEIGDKVKPSDIEAGRPDLLQHERARRRRVARRHRDRRRQLRSCPELDRRRPNRNARLHLLGLALYRRTAHQTRRQLQLVRRRLSFRLISQLGGAGLQPCHAGATISACAFTVWY